MTTWENLLLAALAILVIFWFRPGIAAALERSRSAPKDWAGVLVPLGALVLFVALLITVV